jgi:hypothetical protein
MTFQMSNILFCLLDKILSAQRSNYKCSKPLLNLEMHTFVLYLFYRQFFKLFQRYKTSQKHFLRWTSFQQSSNRLFP